MLDFKFLNPVTKDPSYKGTWLHHLILNKDVSLDNLVYAIAIVRACGGSFDSRDSDDCKPSSLLNMMRCPKYQIYLDIETTTESLVSYTYS